MVHSNAVGPVPTRVSMTDPRRSWITDEGRVMMLTGSIDVWEDRASNTR